MGGLSLERGPEDARRVEPPEEPTADESLLAVMVRNDEWDPVREQAAYDIVRAKLLGNAEARSTLARYELIGLIGSGGLGIVYEAYDPKLRRSVAIKVLRASARSRGTIDNAALLREAQAIARLSHPNVVAVYDVGVVEGTSDGTTMVFLVMELVHGRTLAEWLEAESRGWREIVDALSAAGEGLAAAHAAGIVHRDFKPANVLVGDDDRVRVIDFGIAGDLRASTAEDNSEISTLMAGTPAYMAPEQHRRAAIDARVDQYALCACLYRALYGQPPFSAETFDELYTQKMTSLPPGPPAEHRVPRALHRVIRRGLCPDPAGRFASMEELLTRLRGVARRQRRLWLLGGAVTLLGVAGTVYAQRPAAVLQACSDPAADLGRVWNEDVELGIEARVHELDLGHTEVSWRSTRAVLDEFATTWIETRRDSCETYAVDEDASALGLRMLCLDRQRAQLSEVTRLLSGADALLMENAVPIAEGLPSPADCTDAPLLMAAELDLTGTDREQALELDAEVLRGRILMDAGRYEDADRVAATVERRADELAQPLIGARALLLRAHIAYERGEFSAAAIAAEAALLDAERGGGDDIAVAALVASSRARAALAEHDRAALMLAQARARLERLPHDALAEGRARLAAATLELRKGGWSAAVEEGKAALAFFEESNGPVVDILDALNVVAVAHGNRIDLDPARDAYHRALLLIERALGAGHPRRGKLLNNLGSMCVKHGCWDEARDALESAVEILSAGAGNDSLAPAAALRNLGELEEEQGNFEQAEKHYGRAVELEERNGGRAHDLARTLASLGAIRCGMGRWREGLEDLEHARAVLDARAPDDTMGSVIVWSTKGWCLLAGERWGEAERAFDRGLATSLTPHAGLRARLHWGMGELAMARGDSAAAIEAYERALRALEDRAVGTIYWARIEFSLAQALYERDPSRAVDHAVSADSVLARLGPRQSERDEIRAWLDAHRFPPPDGPTNLVLAGDL